MPRRILALAAGLMVAGALAPAAHAGYTVDKQKPPSCKTIAGNVVGGDEACEPSEYK
jgi:hypothetical protein